MIAREDTFFFLGNFSQFIVLTLLKYQSSLSLSTFWTTHTSPGPAETYLETSWTPRNLLKHPNGPRDTIDHW